MQRDVGCGDGNRATIMESAYVFDEQLGGCYRSAGVFQQFSCYGTEFLRGGEYVFLLLGRC
jgi:hypothetical protein